MGSQDCSPDSRAAHSAQEIQDWLIARLAEELGSDPAAIGVNDPFESFGLASRDAVALSGDLEEWLERRLSPTLLWEYPSISALAKHLVAAPAALDQANRSDRADRSDPIAIVGIGCRFPGASGPEALWQLLRGGVDAIREVPQDRWNLDDYYDPQAGTPAKMNTRWGGFLDDIGQFDPQFFGISPREAVRMDPQQRLVLEVAWEALENGGLAPDGLAGSATGVFIGISTNDYARRQFSDPNLIDAYAGTGNALSIAANRLSYALDLHGPSVAIDTACSSSLVAIHQACQSLRQGECSLALAGGVNVILAPETTVTFSQARMMAADGRCKTFDARADGYVRGEGCGIVVLKRLSEALAEGDLVYAVVRGSAINHDGRSNGLSAPNGLAQQAVLRQALHNAGVDARDVSCIEAHGTGTSLGDPIEVDALKAVLLPGRTPEQACALGSIKTNIGHLESAAGVAGLIKTALALYHNEIPPHLHLMTLNPLIELNDTPFWIPTESSAWPSAAPRRIAGVSAFGFGGTNAHVVLEEAPARREAETRHERPDHVLALSAQSDAALRAMADRYAARLDADPELRLTDLCHTANTGRTHFARRAAIVADTAEQLRERLHALAQGRTCKGLAIGHIAASRGRPAFLFTGQGAQYAGMGRTLYATQTTFRNVLDQCDELLRPHLDRSLKDLLFSTTADDPSLNETIYAQPALFALEYALAQLWRSWGIEPDLLLGHSVGEYAAACVAGAFSLEDGLRLIARRGALMQALPRAGAMAAIMTDAAQVERAIAAHHDTVTLAAFNAPGIAVISGEQLAVAEIVARFEKDGVATRPLAVSHAFHSPLLDPMLDELEQAARETTASPLRIPLVSNLTGKVWPIGHVIDPGYWREHARAPVQFMAGMQTLAEQGCTTFVEIGPAPVAIGMGARCLGFDHGAWLPSLKKGVDDGEVMLASLSAMYVAGAPVDWPGFDRDYASRRVPLPTYPFERARYWIDIAGPALTRPQPVRAEEANPDWLYELTWQTHEASGSAPSKRESGAWLILADHGGIADAASAELTASGDACEVVHTDAGGVDDVMNRLERLRDVNAQRRSGVIDLRYLDAAPNNIERAAEQACERVRELVQGILQRLDGKGAPPPRIWFVTRGVHAADAELLGAGLAQAPVWGFARSLALEHPDLWGGLIDLDPRDSVAASAAALLNTLQSGDGEDQILYRDGTRYVARLLRAKVSRDKSPASLRADGVYLITGGLGALGLRVAQWMVDRGARRMVLVGRSGLPPRAQWAAVDTDTRSARVVAAIQAMEVQGATIIVESVDVGDRPALAGLLNRLAETLPPLSGIVHAAGSVEPQALRDLDAATLTATLRPKVQGAWLLHELTAGLPLDFFVLFSSIASVWGSKMLAHYAAANQFLDALAVFRRAQGLPGLSINWGPWAGAGMSGDTEQVNLLDRMGVRVLAPESALAALEALIGAQAAGSRVVADVRWSTFRTLYEMTLPRPLLSRLEAQKPEECKDAASFPRNRVPADHAARVAFMADYLRQGAARVLHLDAAQLAPDQDLIALGLDSLMIMEMIAELAADFQIKLFPREVFERPTIPVLAEYVVGEFNRGSERAPDEGEQGLAFLSAMMGRAQWKSLPKPVRRNSPAIFILSSPRSGSTLLRVMLAGHPALFCPPELHLLPFTGMQEREAALGATYLGEGIQRALMDLHGLSVEDADRLVAEWQDRDLGVQEVYRELQDRARPRVLIDKSPTYAAQREILARAEDLFEEARYVHLVRHPYAVMESFARTRLDRVLGGQSGDPYAVAEQIWAATNRNAIEFAEGLPSARHIRVYYEALVNEPRRVMTELCAFLDVAFDEAVLKPYEGRRMTDGVHSRSLGVGDPNFLEHNKIDPSLGEAWKRVRPPRRLGGTARRLAESLGYDLPPDSAAPPAESGVGEMEEGRL